MTWRIEDPALRNPEHVVVKTMYDSDHAAVIWFGFSQGQNLRDHETTSAAIIQVLKGRIRLTTTGEQDLPAGESVELKPSVHHALLALEDSVVQLVLVPHPRFHSLQKELDAASTR